MLGPDWGEQHSKRFSERAALKGDKKEQ